MIVDNKITWSLSNKVDNDCENYLKLVCDWESIGLPGIFACHVPKGNWQWS